MQNPETRYALFGCSQPRAVFEKVVATIGDDNTRLNDLRCGNGHAFIRTLRWMAGALFNIFTSNYAAEANSSIHASRSSSSAPSTMATRNQGCDKVRKLTGAKKY